MERAEMKALRHAAGLTQVQLAGVLGVTQGWVSQREAGITGIKTRDAFAIRGALAGQVRAKTPRRTSRKSK